MDLIERIKKLRLGQTFVVRTDTDRQRATQIAKAQGKLVSTRARKRGGFTVTRLPE
jgi:hypothetical protein